MNDLELAQLVEFTEAAAYAEMFRAAPATFDVHVEQSSDYIAFFAPTIDILLFNRVMGLGLKAMPSYGMIESLIQHYRATGVRNFGIQLSPNCVQPPLTDWLAECDLHVRDYWTKVYRSREPAVSIQTDLRVEQIDESLADMFGDVACAGFGMPIELKPMLSGTVGRPGWNHYIAFDEDKPAAAAALYVRNDVGWLGVAATLSEYRRRGAQGALMARRICDGASLGCEWLVTETGQDRPEKLNPSFHNMLRTGFEVAYDRPNFMPRTYTSPAT
jgi:hypothetical protein